jgi:hypothetical protein
MNQTNYMNVVLYSKYSPACKKFMEIVNKLDSFRSKTTTICIDHPDVRSRVMNHPKLSVKKVPSLLRIYEETGYTELFEGDKAFEVLNVYYVNYLQNLETNLKNDNSQQQQQMQQHLLHQQQMQQQHLLQQQPQMLQQQPQMLQQQQMQQQPQMLQQPNGQILPNGQIQNMQGLQNGMSGTNMSNMMSKPLQTSIGALMDLNEIDGGGGLINPNGSNGSNGSNGLSTYVHIPSAKLDQPEIQQGMQAIERSIKKTGEDSIVSRAMQMQKERGDDPSQQGRPENLRYRD